MLNGFFLVHMYVHEQMGQEVSQAPLEPCACMGRGVGVVFKAWSFYNSMVEVTLNFKFEKVNVGIYILSGPDFGLLGGGMYFEMYKGIYWYIMQR